MGFDFRTELGKMTPRIATGAKIYVFGTGANWDKICITYKRLVNIDINVSIDGFIDNNSAKQGTIFHGKQVYALQEIDTANAVVLISIVSWQANKEILKQLLEYDMYELNSVFPIGKWDMTILMRYVYEQFLRLKDKHNAKRCFIIGNGSSLLPSDLDKLENEITFAVNRIYLIFDKTKWRPTYYVCEEDALFEQIKDEIAEHIKCTSFYSLDAIIGSGNSKLTDFLFFSIDNRSRWRPDRRPGFSTEPFITHRGESVTYVCLQIAAYMGFDEIYLLGMDHTFKFGVKINGELIYGDKSQSHFDKRYKPTNIYTSKVEAMDLAFEATREYCDSHGIRIRNATRGGALEVFERVDFDSLF